MATEKETVVVNNDRQPAERRSGAGLVIGIVVAILIVLFLIFGLGMFSGGGSGGTTEPSTTLQGVNRDVI